MTNIVIVRHGSTEWNEKERFRGLEDISLSELGFKQAEATAIKLADMHISKIYSSPLRRAMQTASIIGQSCKLVPIPLDDIVDINYGKFQGLSGEEAETKYKDTYLQWLKYPHLVKFPDGESLAEVKERASAALNGVVGDMVGETILFVSHKVVIIMLICYYLGLADYQFWQVGQDTCAINTFIKQNDNIYAVSLNDTCHLSGIK